MAVQYKNAEIRAGGLCVRRRERERERAFPVRKRMAGLDVAAPLEDLSDLKDRKATHGPYPYGQT